MGVKHRAQSPVAKVIARQKIRQAADAETDEHGTAQRFHIVAVEHGPEARLLPQAALQQAYGDAFSTLLLFLTGITALTAIVVFLFVGRGSEAAEGAEGATEPMTFAAVPLDETGVSRSNL